jgi:hypothetical protein
MSVQYPSDEADVRDLVRGLTLYEDDADEIPQSTLNTQIRIAKMRLATETGSDAFFSDDALGEALVYTTAILAKSAIENYSITSWDLGVGEIDVSGAGDAEQVQFTQWADAASQALASGGHGGGSHGTATNINSANYIN